MASEMLYPIMPIYLKSIGFSVVLIGVLEGMAEATAGLSKGYFGKLSDRRGKRVPFVQLGYGLSAISKPLMVLFAQPIWIFFARSIDRMGKGIRTGARDAILSDESTPETKGRVFGFHRMMDTLGAVLGPLAALIYLYFFPKNYKTLFLLAVLPGILAILCSSLLKEKKLNPSNTPSKGGFLSFLSYLKTAPTDYRKLITGLLLFSLFNSSDVFILLKAKQGGLSDTAVIGCYIFYNLIYALASYPLGILADRWGLKKTFLGGLLTFAGVYCGMANVASIEFLVLLFFLYGIYAAATEGIAKAWITNISAKKDTATAIGTFSALQSICSLLASSIAGFIWFQFGAAPTFLLSAFMTILAFTFLAFQRFQHQ